MKWLLAIKDFTAQLVSIDTNSLVDYVVNKDTIIQATLDNPFVYIEDNQLLNIPLDYVTEVNYKDGKFYDINNKDLKINLYTLNQDKLILQK